MKKDVNPIVLIGVGIVGVLVLIVLAMRVLAPHPPEATIPPPNMMNEGAVKRANIEKQAAGQTAPTDPAATKGIGSDRTGD